MRARETFRYYKLQFENRGGLNGRLEEASFYKHRAGNNTPLVAMTSNNTPAPYVADADTDTANAYRAFDNSAATRWSINNIGRVNITIDCGPDRQRWRDASFVKTDYSASGRQPEEVVLFGSHDDKVYKLLGAVKNTNQIPGGGGLWNLNQRSEATILYKMMYSGFVPQTRIKDLFPLLMKGIDL